MSARPLVGKIALVTGATRGIGKGISLQLAQNGAKVYITGRTMKNKDNLPGSLEATVEEIQARGGVAIPCQVDHEKPEQVKELFDRINKDEKGQLDVLVNNAYKGVQAIFQGMRQKFYQADTSDWDTINNVGLRNHYFCTAYASRIMVPRKKGLIVNISSPGGQMYLFNVPYGIGKVGVDRMAVDCGIELRQHNVSCLSLMLGAVRTEQMMDANVKAAQNDAFRKMFEDGETVEFGGKIITHMATNSKIMSHSAKIVSGADYATSHGITDIDGKLMPSNRAFKNFVNMLPKSKRKLMEGPLGNLTIPAGLLTMVGTKYYKF